MILTIENALLSISILGAAGTIIFAYLHDRQKARYIEHRLIMSTYVAKARTDRNDKVRINTDQICGMFELQERTVPNWKRVPVRHPHPASLPPRRTA